METQETETKDALESKQPVTEETEAEGQESTPSGSAASDEQLKDQEFIERLQRVLSPEALATLVASTPFARQTQQQLTQQAEQLTQQAQQSTAMYRDVTTMAANVQGLIEGMNLITARVTGGAPSGDGKNQASVAGAAAPIPTAGADQPVPTIQFADQGATPGGANPELKYWVKELKDMVFGGNAVAAPANAAGGDIQQVMSMMQTMSEAFKNMFSTVSGVIKEVRMVEQSLASPPAPSRPPETSPKPVGAVHE